MSRVKLNEHLACSLTSPRLGTQLICVIIFKMKLALISRRGLMLTCGKTRVESKPARYRLQMPPFEIEEVASIVNNLIDETNGHMRLATVYAYNRTTLFVRAQRLRLPL
ncbi:hypothetical protein PHMEG_00035832 [Phytophthora megakarya]|uniref:Uncharacterized protein n=1 Tax=Phytophthora megakarya TaxID=4795 RepID=A0A225UMH1_9STRA|nr:hypothetical protein PHMEG_00035832 [Phytophthora megakarya]